MFIILSHISLWRLQRNQSSPATLGLNRIEDSSSFHGDGSDMPDFRGLIANCLIGGDEVTPLKEGGSVRNRVTFQLQEFTLELIQHPDIILGSNADLQGRSIHTTDILVRNIRQSQIPRLESVITDLSWLLSLASLSEVQYFGYEYPDGTGYGRRIAVDGKANCFIPIIHISDGRSVKEFVHMIYPTFKKIKKSRKLPEMIHYLVEGEKTGVIELQLLTVFAVLEGLKDSYARTKYIPYIKGRFRKLPGTRKCQPYSFEELLTMDATGV